MSNVVIVPAYMKKITVNKQTYEIKKLPLRKYADLLKALRKLPQQFSKLDGKTVDEIVEILPGIISEAYPEVVELITIATPIPADVVNSDDFGLYEATEAIIAVIEVNQYQDVYNNVKKMTASQK